jgi:hypothetical protein
MCYTVTKNITAEMKKISTLRSRNKNRRIPSVSYAVQEPVEELVMTIRRAVLLKQNKLGALWPCNNRA